MQLLSAGRRSEATCVRRMGGVACGTRWVGVVCAVMGVCSAVECSVGVWLACGCGGCVLCGSVQCGVAVARCFVSVVFGMSIVSLAPVEDRCPTCGSTTV